MKIKIIFLLTAFVFLNLFSQDKSTPPLTRTYYITNGTRQTCDLWEYKVSDIDSLNMLLVDDVGSIPQIDSDDEILFKCGERYFGQVNLTDASIEEGLTFSSYGTGSKPIIDGSVDHFVLSSSHWDSTRNCYVYNFDSSMPDSCRIINVAIDAEQMIFAREPNVSYDSNDLPVDNFYTITSWDSSSRTLGASSTTFNGYAGAELVHKESKSWYDIRTIEEADGNQCTLNENNDTLLDVAVNYGFFLQNDYNALDTDNEWFVEYGTNLKPEHLYFKTNSSNENKTIYVTGYNVSTGEITSYANGFYVKPGGNAYYTIDSLDFRNMRECIMIGRKTTSSFNNAYITISSCNFSNSLVGVDNFYNSHIYLSDNKFENINSFGFLNRLGDHVELDGDEFYKTGLLLGYERNFFWSPASESINLTAIHNSGDYNTVKNTIIQGVGYCAIKFGARTKTTDEDKGRVIGVVIDNNTIDHALHSFSDGSGIYSWHAFGDPENKNQIINNTISDCVGNNSGTPMNYENGSYQGDGIYLDELACNVEIDNNTITDCSGGIVAQIGRGYVITNNTITNSREYDIMINNGGLVLNGGEINSNDSTNFNFYQSTSGEYSIKDSLYYWNAVHRTLEKSPCDLNEFAYVEPGDNYIYGNNVSCGTSEKSSDYKNFIFRTWKNVDISTVSDITGVDVENDPISSNISDSKSSISVEVSSSDVKYSDDTVNKVGRVNFDPALDLENYDLDGLKTLKFIIYQGTKSEYDK